MSVAPYSGACLCNAIRFIVTGTPSTVCLCHCSTCRRSVGSPGVAWATFRRDDLVVEGTPTWFCSSDHARRGFCGACGTSIFFETKHEAHAIDITVASLHAADRLAPRYHSWAPSKLSWQTITDGLPRFREDGGSLPMEVGPR